MMLEQKHLKASSMSAINILASLKSNLNSSVHPPDAVMKEF